MLAKVTYSLIEMSKGSYEALKAFSVDFDIESEKEQNNGNKNNTNDSLLNNDSEKSSSKKKPERSLTLEEKDVSTSTTKDQDKTEASFRYVPPTIDTEKCVPCDECININPDIFAYNDQKKAIITNPKGPYKDLVKAAEKCKLKIIHPGLPENPEEKGIKMWIERAKNI